MNYFILINCEYHSYRENTKTSYTNGLVSMCLILINSKKFVKIAFRIALQAII